MWYSIELPDDFWINEDGTGPDGQVLEAVTEDVEHLIEQADLISIDTKTVTMLKALLQTLEEED